MAEVLSLSISHHPYTRFKPHMMANVLKGAMTELGATVQWSDFTSDYTLSTLNSSWVSSPFDAK